ncbi:MAG: glycosyltransferase family 2 protein [Bacteroidaceae bacterium]|nr:glycosyltransferase family 2 protein [Bacteroidaceae bacterium]
MHSFSIIIPHHNIPQLLQRCLDSIPDVPDVQVIVVDDNSSADKVDFDHFPGLGRKYTECVFDKQGGGAGHARNVGMQHADGKWLVFADADDFFTKDAFLILDRHKYDPQDIILFKAYSVDSENYTPSNRHQELNRAVDEALAGKISAKVAVWTVPGPVCKMIQRHYVESHHIQFEEVMSSNDMMFVLKSVCWADDNAVVVADEVLYIITTRKNSLFDGRNKDLKNFMCRLDVFIRCNKFQKDYPFLRKEPIIIHLGRSRKFGVSGFLKTLFLILRRRALFSGFSTFMRIVNNHTLKL